MHRSMAFMVWNFQLSPLTAERYSASDMGRGLRAGFGWNTGRPNSAQTSSLRWRNSSSSRLPTWSFLPSSRLTLLMIRWEWM